MRSGGLLAQAEARSLREGCGANGTVASITDQDLRATVRRQPRDAAEARAVPGPVHLPVVPPDGETPIHLGLSDPQDTDVLHRRRVQVRAGRRQLTETGDVVPGF